MRKVFAPNVTHKLEIQNRDSVTRGQLSKVLNGMKTDFDEDGIRRAKRATKRSRNEDDPGNDQDPPADLT
jgi:hypothetical protein